MRFLGTSNRKTLKLGTFHHCEMPFLGTSHPKTHKLGTLHPILHYLDISNERII